MQAPHIILWWTYACKTNIHLIVWCVAYVRHPWRRSYTMHWVHSKIFHTIIILYWPQVEMFACSTVQACCIRCEEFRLCLRRVIVHLWSLILSRITCLMVRKEKWCWTSTSIHSQITIKWRVDCRDSLAERDRAGQKLLAQIETTE